MYALDGHLVFWCLPIQSCSSWQCLAYSVDANALISDSPVAVAVVVAVVVVHNPI